MPDLTFPQLNEQQGTDTADTLRNIGNAAANIVCELWEAFPQSLIPSLADPLGSSAFMDGMMRNLCTPRGKTPAPPVPPFTGGQCDVLYNLNGTLTSDRGSEFFDVGNGFGKLTNLRTTSTQTPAGEVRNWVIDQGVGTPSVRLGVVLASSLLGPANPSPSYSFTPTRVDGLPDNCGNPPPEYPRTIPPPEFYDRPAPVNIYNTPVTVPVVIIPVTFSPGSIVFRPEVNVDVGGVVVNIDLGGINFNVGKDAPQTPTIPGVDPRPIPPAPTSPNSPLAKCEPYDDSALQCRVESLQDGLLDGGFDIINGQTATAVSGSYLNTSGGFFKVAMVITQRPANLRIQSSDSPAPDVWYVGWFAWTKDGRPGLRQPLHFEEQSWLAPDDVDGFIYQLNRGCLGSGVWQRRVKRDYVDVC